MEDNQQMSSLEAIIRHVLGGGILIVSLIFALQACSKSDKNDIYKNSKNERHRNSSTDNFVGTYRFECETASHAIIIVGEDGRCVIKHSEEEPQFLGNVVPLSSHAFKIKPSDVASKFILSTDIYKNGICKYRTGSSYWYTSDVVFDISEGKLYRQKTEYENRDIAGAEYAKMTHSSSTELPTRTCKTCGKQYNPDDEFLVSDEYCSEDYPQTCQYCGKIFTINTDAEAVRGTCGYCYERKRAVRIYESVTGRKVY